MKLKNGDGSLAISFGNILTMIVIIASCAVVYGSMDGSIERLEEDVKRKADRELLQTHLDYISSQIQDLKVMVTKLHSEQ